MKAITIKQPFASLIVEGVKDIENRTWKTNFRGRVLIHAGASIAGSALDLLTQEQFDVLVKNNKGAEYVTSSIIGSVEIVDCVINHESIWAEKGDSFLTGESSIIYNWVLANPIKFPEPIPAKGKLSFWDFPIINTEPCDGEMICLCSIAVDEEIQVRPLGGGTYECRFCQGKWSK